MSSANEFFQQIKHAAQQQIGEQRWFHIGHIAAYDPDKGTVTVVLPVMRGSNDNKYMVSPKISFGSPWVGPGFGFQYFPIGGATPEHPTNGEQVIVDVLERSYGAMVVSASLYNQRMPPPNVVLPNDKKLRPGEAILVSPARSFLRFHINGDIEVSTELTPDQHPADILLTSKRDVKVKAQGDVSVEAGGDVSLKAGGKIKLETKEIDIDAGNDALTVNIKAKDNVDINADDLTVTLNCKNAEVNADNDIFLRGGGNITITAANTLELHGERIWIDGRDIVIGNENNTLGSTNTNTIRIDAMRLKSIGRITHKIIGTTISIGTVIPADGFPAHRIDIIANRGG